jgi:hypothetical protein
MITSPVGKRSVALLLCLVGQAPPGVSLPVEQSSHVFFARTTINDRGPFWLTVDTGATLTVIDPETAKDLGLPLTDAGARADVGVGGGSTPLATTRGARFTIGEAGLFVPSPLYVVPVRGNQPFLGHRIDGVLGTDFLSRHIVEFDYSNGRVVLHAPGGFKREGLPTAVAVTIGGNVLLAPAALTLPDGSVQTARLLIDTGSNLGLTLTSPFVRQHRLVERFPSRRATAAAGINGLVASPLVTLGALSIGEAGFGRVDVALSRDASGLNASAAFEGIIGADLLRHFRVIVDYPGRRIYLARHPHAARLSGTHQLTRRARVPHDP